MALVSECQTSNYKNWQSSLLRMESVSCQRKRSGAYFAEQDTFGQVRVGHRADLILVDADPIANIATVFEPAGVMAQGHWHSREAIAAKLAEIAAAYQAE